MGNSVHVQEEGPEPQASAEMEDQGSLSSPLGSGALTLTSTLQAHNPVVSHFLQGNTH
eukprot:CAMPEP_0119320188 /NCGR_PEP_ID=MMETSP1333-20130426/51786_1 /TAXON_ID=418940 /ORGANISM="Scyphosphaera apsteinii, Strain RCC1455" /LENGTH=57 /DNA_ID=CAMNT_0007326849 /DNA_START=203 /DNA_END=376 /DNA_ORIENTATION=-